MAELKWQEVEDSRVGGYRPQCLAGSRAILRGSEEDHRAWPIVLGDHVEACYEGRVIVLIPECKLCVLLLRMMSQRADLQSQAAHIRAELDQAMLMGWVPHNTDECFMRRREDQLEILMLVVEREARMSQAISHAIQRLWSLTHWRWSTGRIRSAGTFSSVGICWI